MPLPMSVIQSLIDNEVVITLKDGRVLEGKLVGYDNNMNLVLEKTKEQYNDTTRVLGTVIIRGNNIVSISVK
ncbi:RNA-binding protein [Candidatus Woesearchaeota archaeon]|nr:MAG: RNA-binding protein [Candidatus Woesearchaeota archaeon]